MTHHARALTIVGTLATLSLLAGCAADHEQLAADACRDAVIGRLAEEHPDLGRDVRSESKVRSDEGGFGVLHVSGSLVVDSGDHTRYFTWACFAQVVDGSLHVNVESLNPTFPSKARLYE